MEYLFDADTDDYHLDDYIWVHLEQGRDRRVEIMVWSATDPGVGISFTPTRLAWLIQTLERALRAHKERRAEEAE